MFIERWGGCSSSVVQHSANDEKGISFLKVGLNNLQGRIAYCAGKVLLDILEQERLSTVPTRRHAILMQGDLPLFGYPYTGHTVDLREQDFYNPKFMIDPDKYLNIHSWIDSRALIPPIKWDGQPLEEVPETFRTVPLTCESVKSSSTYIQNAKCVDTYKTVLRQEAGGLSINPKAVLAHSNWAQDTGPFSLTGGLIFGAVTLRFSGLKAGAVNAQIFHPLMDNTSPIWLAGKNHNLHPSSLDCSARIWAFLYDKLINTEKDKSKRFSKPHYILTPKGRLYYTISPLVTTSYAHSHHPVTQHWFSNKPLWWANAHDLDDVHMTTLKESL